MGAKVMRWYILSTGWDADGNNLYKCISATDADKDKYIEWLIDHQKGRVFTKKSFGEMHFQWEPLDPANMPIADFPSGGGPGGIFSRKAVNALIQWLDNAGDLHSLIMDEKDQYFLFDCWVYISIISMENGSITINAGTALPDLFRDSARPGLFVNESFKQSAESAGLTGMVFSPVDVVRISRSDIE